MSYIFLFFQWFKILSREICTIIYSTKTYSKNLDFAPKKSSSCTHYINCNIYTKHTDSLHFLEHLSHIQFINNFSTIKKNHLKHHKKINAAKTSQCNTEYNSMFMANQQ